jgi:hypothetical protein
MQGGDVGEWDCECESRKEVRCGGETRLEAHPSPDPDAVESTMCQKPTIIHVRLDVLYRCGTTDRHTVLMQYHINCV